MVFTCVFFLEMTIKVIASGFICGEGAYLHSGWNQLDFVVVVASVMAILGEVSTELESLRVLRTLRVLRPLSLLSRDPGTRLLVSTLFESSASVFNALGILVALQVFFAILGMQLFSGRMASCSDPTSLTRIDCKLSPPPLPPPMPLRLRRYRRHQCIRAIYHPKDAGCCGMLRQSRLQRRWMCVGRIQRSARSTTLALRCCCCTRWPRQMVGTCPCS